MAGYNGAFEYCSLIVRWSHNLNNMRHTKIAAKKLERYGGEQFTPILEIRNPVASGRCIKLCNGAAPGVSSQHQK